MKIWKATAKWSEGWSSGCRPGWVVEIEHIDGGREVIAPSPTVYHETKCCDPRYVVTETLKWEGLDEAS